MPTPAGLPIATRADSSSIAADATTIFRPDYSLSLREPEHHPPPLLSVSPGSNSTGRRSEHPAMRMSSSPRPDGASSQASSRGQSQQGQHPLSRSRSGSPSSFANCGVAHERYSQTLRHSGPRAEQHLRSAAALFASALTYQPDSTWAALRRAGVLLHLSGHCHYDEQMEALLESRQLLVSLGEADGAREALASVCGRLSELHPQASQYATEALEALEDIAAERMDQASTLTREEFANETPALADTFLSLANAAARVSNMADDLDASDMYAELTERALEQAANMANMSAVADPEAAAALAVKVELGSAAIVAARLKHLVHLGIGLGEVEMDWTYLLLDLGELANSARQEAAQLRGSKGAAATSLAYQAVKQVADTRVQFATLLQHRIAAQEVLSPSTVHSDGTFGSTPALEHSLSSLSIASGSLDSPPILEETEAEVAAADSGQAPPISPILPSPPNSPLTFGKAPKRAPPPPPLQLRQNPIPCNVQVIQLQSPRRPGPVTPFTPAQPLPPSPLNPARRASDSVVMRPNLIRGPSFQRPRRATANSISPITPHQPDAHAAWHHLAAAVKGYKLALALLSGSDLKDAERKSTLLLAIARVSLDRAVLAGKLHHTSPFQQAPPTPRTDPSSGSRATGEAALLATAEVYATWAAREVGWSKVLDTAERGDSKGARADELGLAAVLTTLEVWEKRDREDVADVWQRLEQLGVTCADVERARARARVV